MQVGSNVLNEILFKAEDFVPVPTPCPECRVLVFPRGSRNKQYVNCSEQDCENLVYFYDQSQSMIKILNLNETPEWQSGSRSSMSGTTRSTAKRTNGLGRPRMIERVGTRDHQSVLKVCRHKQKVEHTRMRTPSHGKILVQPTSNRASSILQVMLNVLLSSSN